ncbi:MAG TPA: hypothetical protein VEP49_05510 [Acidimicrobiia bacterium]|nr:hypothetical protein [Acidimicrobiia bacterium]
MPGTAIDGITDDELCAEALAADPDIPVAADAVSFWDLTDPAPGRGALPDWYMPSPMAGPRSRTGWRRLLIRCNVALIIAAFVTINAYGLCNTYGQLHF